MNGRTGKGTWAGTLRVAVVLASGLLASFASSPPARPASQEGDRVRVVLLADEFGKRVRPDKREVYEAIVQGLRDGLEAASLSADLKVLSFERDKDLIRPRIAEARDLAPTVVFALGSSSLRVLLSHRDELGAPLAFTGVLHPERYLDPKRPVPGVSLDIDGRIQIAIVRRHMPWVERIGVVYHPDESSAQVARLEAGVRTHGGTLLARPARNTKEAVRAVDELESEGLDCFLLLPDSLLADATLYQRIRQASVRRDIPIVTPSRRHLLDDALLSLEVDYARVGRDSAQVVARIVRGESPEEIGILRQTVPFLGLNEKIARALGIALPRALKERADFTVH